MNLEREPRSSRCCTVTGLIEGTGSDFLVTGEFGKGTSVESVLHFCWLDRGDLNKLESLEIACVPINLGCTGV